MSETNLHLKTLGGNIYAASTDVAKHFQKDHKNVLQSIELILASPERYFGQMLEDLETTSSGLKNQLANPSSRLKNQEINPSSRPKIGAAKPTFAAADYDILRQFVAEKHYQETTYIDAQGKSRRAYLMDRDGFVLLAMSFTTLPAMVWKIRYLSAFNAMENRLTAQHAQAQQALLFPDLDTHAERQTPTLTTAAAAIICQHHGLDVPAITPEVIRRHIQAGTLSAKRGRNNRYEIDRESFTTWLTLRRAA